MPQKSKSKKQLKKEKSAKAANNTPAGQMSGASNQQGMAAKINGSMSRMGNPSKPQYPVIKMKSLKYFRPYSAWNVGPVAGSIVLAEAIGFEINDFITTASLESWEEKSWIDLNCFGNFNKMMLRYLTLFTPQLTL